MLVEVELATALVSFGTLVSMWIVCNVQLYRRFYPEVQLRFTRCRCCLAHYWGLGRYGESMAVGRCIVLFIPPWLRYGTVELAPKAQVSSRMPGRHFLVRTRKRLVLAHMVLLNAVCLGELNMGVHHDCWVPFKWCRFSQTLELAVVVTCSPGDVLRSSDKQLS